MGCVPHSETTSSDGINELSQMAESEAWHHLGERENEPRCIISFLRPGAIDFGPSKAKNSPSFVYLTGRQNPSDKPAFHWEWTLPTVSKGCVFIESYASHKQRPPEAVLAPPGLTLPTPLCSLSPAFLHMLLPLPGTMLHRQTQPECHLLCETFHNCPSSQWVFPSLNPQLCPISHRTILPLSVYI